MVKELQFWFSQFADVNVNVGATPVWSASYSVGTTPTSWISNQSQTYSVTVTNTGSQLWPSGGGNPVRLSAHFANAGGGAGNNTWFSDQHFSLPADLAPGASVTLSITVTAPGNAGNLVLEYQMVKELQFWFGQFADVNVSVLVPWSASYSVGATPTSWSSGQSQTYSVTVTNTGSQLWPSGGGNPVRLSAHFANAGGGAGSNTWYSDQHFSLPADRSAGGSVGLSVTVTAPRNTYKLVLEYQMVRELQFWFSQFADVNVNVCAPPASSYS